MSTDANFESLHPRVDDGTFTTKPQSSPETSLETGKPDVDHQASDWLRRYDHNVMVAAEDDHDDDYEYIEDTFLGPVHDVPDVVKGLQAEIQRLRAELEAKNPA